VVKPPKMPGIQNCRVTGLTSTRPSGPVSVATKPIRNDPTTLTTRVPQGNVSPNERATRPESP